MSDGTKISWSDATWNVVTGCSKTSEGCLNCYIDRTPPFRMAHRKFNGPGIGATTGVQLHSERLGLPMKWRKPRMIFVCSLADLFQDEVPDRFIADVFAVISIATQHIFQVLTKRHARMRSLLKSPEFWSLVDAARVARGYEPLRGKGEPPALENAWIGVSTENQKWADIRIPALLDTPAVVRWISAEPLLGPIDLGVGDPHAGHQSDNVHGYPHPPVCLTCSTDDNEVEYFRRDNVSSGLRWVVCGGESGPNARPMHPDWARGLRDQCVAAGIAYHFKQWGEHVVREQMTDEAFTAWDTKHGSGVYPEDMQWRMGKKLAGRELDGRTWDEFPASPVGAA